MSKAGEAPQQLYPSDAALPDASASGPRRNPRIDFFRGLAIITIFINHIPFNSWYWATPSRFGFSDATDIFVFISGFAFGLSYQRRLEADGLLACLKNAVGRCGQIYVAHILMFISVLLVCLMGNSLMTGQNYILAHGLEYVFAEPALAIWGALTLTYVPNYLDILPMYIVILLLAPFVLAAGNYNKWLFVALPVSLYFGARYFDLEFPGQPDSDREWYFNPLCWQLLFFTGVAMGTRRLSVPRFSLPLVCLAAVVLLAGVVVEFGATFYDNPLLWSWRNALADWTDKSHMGFLRYAHFLALAYVLSLYHPASTIRPLSWVTNFFRRVGRLSLPMFVMTMTLSYVCGIALDLYGRTDPVEAIVNSCGLVLIFFFVCLLEKLEPRPKPAVAVQA